MSDLTVDEWITSNLSSPRSGSIGQWTQDQATSYVNIPLYNSPAYPIEAKPDGDVLLNFYTGKWYEVPGVLKFMEVKMRFNQMVLAKRKAIKG